jgi:hypothetical protein
VTWLTYGGTRPKTPCHDDSPKMAVLAGELYTILKEWRVVSDECLVGGQRRVASSLGSSTPTTSRCDTCKESAANWPPFVSCVYSYPSADCRHGLDHRSEHGQEPHD